MSEAISAAVWMKNSLMVSVSEKTHPHGLDGMIKHTGKHVIDQSLSRKQKTTAFKVNFNHIQ